MKQLYFILFTIITGVSAFAQTIYSENFGTTATGNPVVTTYTGWQNSSPIVYAGTASARTTTASTGYSGASGSVNVFLGVTSGVGQYFQVSGINTSTHQAENLALSFGYIKSAATGAAMLIEVSTDGSAWTTLTFTDNTNASWNYVTIAGGQIPSAANVYLKFTNTSTATSSAPNFRIDDLKLVDTAAACSFVYGTPTTLCDAITYNIDTYTATIPYTGAGNGSYTVTASSGTVGGDNPTSVAAGNITVSGVNEGTSLTVTVNGNNCTNEQLIVVPQSCKPINALPYYEPFDYTASSALGSTQMWSNANSGDEVVIAAGNLNYSGLTPIGNSATILGAGMECQTPFTSTTSGNIYAGFLMNITDYSNVTTDLTETTIAILTDGVASNFKARLYLKKNGTQYQLGFDSATTTTNYYGTNFNVGDVVYVVLGYDFAANTLKAWFNPDVATFTESTTPSLTATPSAAITSLGGFVIRQDTDTKTPSITFDELRIATTLPEILKIDSNFIQGFSMYPNPTKNQLFINTANNLTKNVAIFDVLGKQVVNQQVAGNSMNLNLNTGIYFIKVEEAGKTVTKKLVIE